MVFNEVVLQSEGKFLKESHILGVLFHVHGSTDMSFDPVRGGIWGDENDVNIASITALLFFLQLEEKNRFNIITEKHEILNEVFFSHCCPLPLLPHF